MKTRGWIVLVSALVMTAGLAGCGSGNNGNSSIATCQYNAFGTAARPVDTPPTENVSRVGTAKVTMTMDAGVVTMDFDRSSAPCAVNSFESLAKQKYYDDTSCHRLSLGFVLQCGDPTGNGTGGPGYQYKDELSGNETYPYGTVAMANAGPDTNGSQFFIVLGDNAGLGPSYVVLGHVEPDSMKVIESIAAQGVDPNDPSGIKSLEGAHIQTITVS